MFLAPGVAYDLDITTPGGVSLPGYPAVDLLSVPTSSSTLAVDGTVGIAATATQVVYLSDGSGSKTAGQWFLADADFTYASTLPEVGFVPADVAINTSGVIQQGGRLEGFTGLTIGAAYYISATAGAITATPPTNARYVGQADSTTSLVISPSTRNAATLTGTETLTNKTLAAPTVTSAMTLTGGQITFPATQVPSSDANTLDDYEEGSWVPVLGGASSQSGQAYAIQAGRYVKVGKLVTCYGRVVLSTLGTVTGNVVIRGLPFTSTSTANVYGTVTIGQIDTLGVNFVSLMGFVSPAVAYAELGGIKAAGVASAALVSTDLGNNSGFIFSVVYEAAA